MAPDMTALALAYESPTGTFAAGEAELVVDAARDVAEQLEFLGIHEALLEIVGLASSAAREQVRAEAGYLTVTRICAGWAPGPVPDTANGAFELTALFDAQGIEPVVWGEVVSCRYLIDGRRVVLSGAARGGAGAFRLLFAEPVSDDELAERSVLVDFDATAVVDESPVLFDFDFRADPVTATFEQRVTVADGEVVVVTSGGSLTGVRAKNGDFVCEESSRNCVSDTATVTF